MLTLTFEDRAYNIEPNFEVVCEIEEELGSTFELLGKFSRDEWYVSELVTLIHILIQSAGRTVDYVELGNSMMKDDLGNYVSFANKFLRAVIYK